MRGGRSFSREALGRDVNRAYFLLSVVEGCFGIGLLPFLLRVLGSAAEAHARLSSFWLAMTLAELPTGYVSDRIGPRASLLLSIGLRAGALILFYLGASSPGLLWPACLLAGVAVTLLTGSFSMQLKLAARRHGLALDFPRLAAQGAVYRHAGLVAGALFGFALLRWEGLPSIWLGSLAISARELLLLPQLARAFLLNALLLLLTLPLLGNWVVVFVPGLEETPFALLAGTVTLSLVRALAAALWPRFPTRVSTPLVAVGIVGVCTALAALPAWPYGGVAFGVGLVFLTGAEIELRSAILARLPADEAGTLASIQSLLENLAGFVGYAALGVTLRVVSVPASWVISGSALLVVALLFARGLAKKRE